MYLPLCHSARRDFAGGFGVTVFRSRFTSLRVSRPSGERASPRHLRERNYTSTTPKLSKTLRSRPFIPDRFVISKERIAAAPCARFSYAPTTMPYLTAQGGLGVSLGSRLPTSHPPSHPLWALPCSTSKTPTTCCRWRVAGCPIRSLWLPSVGAG